MDNADNCDINPTCPRLDYICEMDAIPVGNDTYDEVWSIHSIEHIPFHRVDATLREWHRITKHGGWVSIDTPNIDRNVELYMNGDWLTQDYPNLTQGEQEALQIDGVPHPTLWLNFKCFSSANQWDVHYWNASPDLLVTICLRAGFREAVVTQIEPSVIVKAYK